MKRVIYPTGGRGIVNIPSSKSDVHRILIAAALAGTPTEVVIRGMSKDVEVTMNCLRALGSSIELAGTEVWKVEPIKFAITEKPELFCGESGSTLRFLLPVAAAVTDSFSISGEGRLPERPITELSDQMKQKGCTFSAAKLPFEVSGRLTGGIYKLPGNISSQYITGLLFALPLLPEDSEIILTTALESGAYVDMTITTLEEFNIRIEPTASGFRIPGRQTYCSPGRIEAEGDWSSAAFFLALGAIKGPVILNGLKTTTRQADFAILELLERFGAEVIVDQAITVNGGHLQGIDINAAEIPDLVPILAVIAAAAEGTTRIHHAERLRIKESDRLTAMCEGLSRAGIQIWEQPDGLIISGRTAAVEELVQVSGFNDHRIVMAMTVAAVGIGRDIIIDGTEAVEKSYPTFFTAWEQTGGKTDVI